MRVTEKHHREQPWRVHELAADFELLDVWQFKLKSKGRPEVDRFLAAVWSAFDDIAESRLSRLGRAAGNARDSRLYRIERDRASVCRRAFPVETRAAARISPESGTVPGLSLRGRGPLRGVE
ncbi:MAG: hypothetical protein HY074_14155 [Deltaproteobacteria bacterium]|nr:hypothetical protein [Deltaproteobacteria bacterium]